MVLQGGVGLLLADHLAFAGQEQPYHHHGRFSHIAQATLHMLAACVRPSLATFAEASARD